jgi:hypothetical protein
MASWNDLEAEAADLAASAKAYFDAHRHKTLATIRSDGSPRISGIETTFALGEVWLGSMAGAVKGADLKLDPRCALHSGSDDPPDESAGDSGGESDSGWSGDAKLAGRAVEVTDPGEKARFVEVLRQVHPETTDEPFDLFRLDITELVTTRVGDPADHLVITSWHQGRGITIVHRS